MEFRCGDFYLRRILRIWPLYFLLIAVGVVLAHTMAKQRLPWYYVAGYLLFVGNWVHAVFGRPESICSPLWTVSIEEQFYLIWPLLMKMLTASRHDRSSASLPSCWRPYAVSALCSPAGAAGSSITAAYVALRLVSAGYSSGAVRGSSAPAYPRRALAAAGRGPGGVGRVFGLA